MSAAVSARAASVGVKSCVFVPVSPSSTVTSMIVGSVGSVGGAGGSAVSAAGSTDVEQGKKGGGERHFPWQTFWSLVPTNGLNGQST